MDALAQDLRFALRHLRKTPVFALTAIATLAIGIGATTSIFSTVNATLLRPLPFPQPQNLMSLRTTLIDGRVSSGQVAAVEIARLNDPQLSIIRAAGVLGQPFDATLLRDDGTPVHTALHGVTEGFFDVFGLPMTIGRGFTHDDHTVVNQTVPFTLVLSHRVWTAMFGADPNIVGTSLRFAEANGIVVGVASRDFDVPRGADFWFSLRIDPNAVAHILDGFLRVRPGTSEPRLRSELASVMTGLARDFPNTAGVRAYVVRPLVAAIVGDLGPTLLMVLAATALLLVLACVNVTNLLLARGTARTREVAVRCALGAGQSRILRQLLTESVVLAAVGAIAGLFLAYAGVRLLLVLGASKLPRLENVAFDARVLLFALGTLLISGLTIGFAPALRLASTDLKKLMNESGRTATGGRATFRLMGSMIVAEIALAITLVTGAGWLVQSFARLRAVDPGFAATGRLVFDVRPSFRKFRDPSQAVAWSRDMLDRVRAIPGIRNAGSTITFPLRADRDGILFVQIQGEPFDLAHAAGGRFRRVTPGFFSAMGIRVAAGRDFTPDDRQGAAPVAIVNRAFARRYIAAKDPLHAQFAFGYPTIDQTTMRAVVGIVDDVKYKSLGEDAEPAFYVPQAQAPYVQHAVVAETTLADPRALIPAIRNELKQLDPQLDVEFERASDIVAATLMRQALGMTLMVLFGVTALALAAVGIYGVIAYASAQRTGEVATRIALGASASDVFWLMMKQGQGLVLVGTLLGVAAAYVCGRAVSSSVFEMKAFDPVILTSACALVFFIAIVATVIPARRAAHVNPVIALRSE
jgi:putative ABC transport system permease protein